MGVDSRALRQAILWICFGDLEHQIHQKPNPAFVSPRLLEIRNRPGGGFIWYKWKRRGLGARGSSGKRRFSHLSVQQHPGRYSAVPEWRPWRRWPALKGELSYTPNYVHACMHTQAQGQRSSCWHTYWVSPKALDLTFSGKKNNCFLHSPTWTRYPQWGRWIKRLNVAIWRRCLTEATASPWQRTVEEITCLNMMRMRSWVSHRTSWVGHGNWKKKKKKKKSVIPWVKVLEVFQVCQLSQLGFPGLTDSDSRPDCQNYDLEANSCSFLVTRLHFPVKPPCGTIVPLSAQEGNLWFLLETGECQAHSPGCWLRVGGHSGLEGSPGLWRWTAMQERLSPSGWIKILIL